MEETNLIEGLNRDLAQELAAICRSIQHYTSRLREAEGAWAEAIKARLERILVEEAEHERKLRDLLEQQNAPAAARGTSAER